MATFVPATERRTQSRHLPFGDRQDAPFYGMDILSVLQFRRDDLEYIFGVAQEMRAMVERIGTFDLLKGKILANLFYEPSTRTSSSFLAAMERMGGSVIPINEVTYSSVAKGESLPDTVRTLQTYADVIVLRHPEVGSAKLAAQYTSKPNHQCRRRDRRAPDAKHYLDLFHNPGGARASRWVDCHHVRRPQIRAYSTLAFRLLSLFDVHINYVSPEILGMPPELLTELTREGMQQRAHTALAPILPDTDVLYVTRVQKERFDDLDDYEAVKGAYVITPETLEAAKDEMIVMHPFPRVGEISIEVDDDPRAAYFRQMEYGLYVRMALLAMVLGKA